MYHDIKSLQKTFEKHHKKASQEEEKRRKQHIKDYGEPPPSYGDFSLPKALAYMCKCIEQCVKKTGDIK